jgi:hypothetical protein
MKLGKFSTLLLALASIAGSGRIALGQADAGLTQSPLRGIIPGHSYSISDIETIGTANGNVMLDIPIVSLPPGRGGLTAGLRLHYDSKIWNASATIQKWPDGVDRTTRTLWPAGGWHYAYLYGLTIDVRTDHYSSDTPVLCPAPEAYLKFRYFMDFPDGSSVSATQTPS